MYLNESAHQRKLYTWHVKHVALALFIEKILPGTRNSDFWGQRYKCPPKIKKGYLGFHEFMENMLSQNTEDVFALLNEESYNM